MIKMKSAVIGLAALGLASVAVVKVDAQPAQVPQSFIAATAKPLLLWTNVTTNFTTDVMPWVDLSTIGDAVVFLSLAGTNVLAKTSNVTFNFSYSWDRVTEVATNTVGVHGILLREARPGLGMFMTNSTANMVTNWLSHQTYYLPTNFTVTLQETTPVRYVTNWMAHELKAVKYMRISSAVVGTAPGTGWVVVSNALIYGNSK